MNLEVVNLNRPIDLLLEKIQPLDYHQFSGYKDVDSKCKHAIVCANAVKEDILSCCELGTTISRDVFKLCFILSRIIKNLNYVCAIDEDGIVKDYVNKSLSFSYISDCLGLSRTASYAYACVGNYFLANDGTVLPVYSGYNLSQLIEMSSFFDAWYLSDNPNEIVPATTTIDELRRYKKIMKLYSEWKPPFHSSYEIGALRNCVDKNTTLPDVLKLYSEWEQKKANKELEDKLSGKNVAAVETFAQKADETEKVYLDGQEYTVPVKYQAFVRGLEEENDKLRLNAVPELGNCDGCQFKDKNLNKCRCCRRYKDLKDLYQK